MIWTLSDLADDLGRDPAYLLALAYLHSPADITIGGAGYLISTPWGPQPDLVLSVDGEALLRRSFGAVPTVVLASVWDALPAGPRDLLRRNMPGPGYLIVPDEIYSGVNASGFPLRDVDDLLAPLVVTGPAEAVDRIRTISFPNQPTRKVLSDG